MTHSAVVSESTRFMRLNVEPKHMRFPYCFEHCHPHCSRSFLHLLEVCVVTNLATGAKTIQRFAITRGGAIKSIPSLYHHWRVRSAPNVYKLLHINFLSHGNRMSWSSEFSSWRVKNFPVCVWSNPPYMTS